MCLRVVYGIDSLLLLLEDYICGHNNKETNKACYLLYALCAHYIECIIDNCEPVQIKHDCSHEKSPYKTFHYYKKGRKYKSPKG